MEPNQITELIIDRFPGILGCILTGSRKSNYSNGSDVDIVVFDATHPNVVSHSFEFEGIIFDCTIFPLLDIQNVIVNESQDKRGVVLSMIISGTIIFDTNNIVKDIQLVIKYLCKSLRKEKKTPLLSKAISDLPTIRKYLDRTYSTSELFILLCDFVSIITTIETHYREYWQSTFYRKAKLLSETADNMPLQLMEMFEKALKSLNTDELKEFIDSYLQKKEIDEKLVLSKYFSIELYTGTLSWNKFFEKFVPLVISNEILGGAFLFSFRSDYKYRRLYPYDISLFFQFENEKKKEKIVKEFISILILNGFVDPVLQIVQLPVCLVGNVTNTITEFRQLLFKFKTSIYRSSEPGISILCFNITLCQRIIEYLQISNQDAYQVCDILSSKWLLPKPVHNNTTSGKEFSRLLERRVEESNALFKKNQHLLNVFDNVKIHELGIDTIVEKCFDLFKNDFLRVEHFLPDSLLNYILIEDLQQTRILLFVIPEIFQMFNLEESEKLICLSYLKKNIP